jgi:RND family efflux transporter MFP subunit
MKRSLKWGLSLLVVLVLGAAIGRVLVGRKAAAPAAAAVKAPAALELAASDVLTLRVEDLSRTLDISGSLFAVNSAFVKARVAAEVKSLSVREGDTVRAGQVLGQLETTEFDWRLRQAEQQAAAARSQLDIAQRTLTNNTALMAQGFISATGLEQAVATEAGAQATLQAALAGVELARKSRGDATISAPIAGQIAQRLVQPGERVPVDARLLEIVDLSRIELQAAIAPEDAGQLRVGASALLRIDGIDAGVPARVARINPSAQSGSRSVLAYLELAPNPALRQGLFARGTIELERRSALAVPLSALRTDQAKPYVLRIEGGQVTPRVPELGARGLVGATEVVEVRQGLAAGDRVLAGSVGGVPAGTAVRTGMAAQATPPTAATPPRAASTAP